MHSSKFHCKHVCHKPAIDIEHHQNSLHQHLETACVDNEGVFSCAAHAKRLPQSHHKASAHPMRFSRERSAMGMPK